MLHVLRLLPLVVFAALAGFLAWQLGDAETGASRSDPMLQKPLPELALPIFRAESETLRFQQLRGQAFLLNVFASWCAGCALEHETLSKFAEHKALPLYGIAWKDKKENLSNWLVKMGNPYKSIVLDEEGRAAIELGVTGAPETYLIASDGTIVALYRGVLNESAIQAYFEPVISSLKSRE